MNELLTSPQIRRIVQDRTLEMYAHNRLFAPLPIIAYTPITNAEARRRRIHAAIADYRDRLLCAWQHLWTGRCDHEEDC